METEILALRTARKQVHNYTDESAELMHRHAEAIECRECEDFLQLGIDACKWLARADEAIRGAIYRREMGYDVGLQQALSELYSEWLRPCDYAEQWIAAQKERGFHVDNADEFLACCREVRAIVEANEGPMENDALVKMRDEAIDAHRRGETLEFWGNEQPQDA